jgi:serine/threonine protein kinase
MPEVSPLRTGDPKTLAGYRLEGLLGEGGQGAVYLARDIDGEAVAIKILYARVAGDTTVRARFAREINAARRVAPFCTARVLAADVEGDIPYLVSELIDGPALQQAIQQNGPMHGPELERLAIGTLTALAAIHQAGIVHRDFKPANVLLSPQGPRVVDFGIARALDQTSTLTSQALGTPAYMAPEQLEGTTIGPAADMFAWGCTIAYAATGGPPYGNDTVPAVISRILDEEPDLSGMAAGPLRDMVAHCLDKDASARPTAETLLAHLTGEPTSLGNASTTMAKGAHMAEMTPTMTSHRPFIPPSPGDPIPPDRTRKAAMIGAAALVVLLAAGIGVFTVPHLRHGHPSPTAATPPPPTPSIPVQVAGWNSVADQVDKIAYDVPPSWQAAKDFSIEIKAPGHGPKAVLWGGGVDRAPCGNDTTDLAMMGFMAYENVALKLVAQDAATSMINTNYARSKEDAATLNRRPRTVESVTINGMSAVHVTVDLPVSPPYNCERPQHAVIHTVAMQSRGRKRVITFVLMAVRNVANAVPDQTLQQIIGSLRPSPV